MKKFRRITAVIFTLLVCSVFVPAALAHPLGNFTINQYVGLQISREVVLIDYVLDMAEIPAFQEISTFDANGNDQADLAEAAGYHAQKCSSLQSNLSLFLNKKVLQLTLLSSSVEFPAGVGGLPTLRLTCEFRAPLDAATGPLKLSFTNNVLPDRMGWKEIVVMPDGVSLQGDFSTTSRSNRLSNYPEDLLSSPLEQREVSIEITSLGAPAQSSSAVEKSTLSSTNQNDAFTRLILLEEINLSTILLAIGISFIWGAMHALTPGHGKTIVGAYLVGSRGTLRHAVYLGLTTTITHTLGVFAFGLITLFAAQYIVPEQLYPWMTLLSGLFVVGIGISLFASRFKSSGPRAWFSRVKTKVVRSRPSHTLVFEHIPAEEMAHSYVLDSIPQHTHDHDHGHLHSHHGHHHEHNHSDHSHLPPGADGSPITWRSLLALGVSGGLIPCPSALIVLLGAIALNKIGFGIILVLAFSLGLAATLTAIGMMFIYAGRIFERLPAQGKAASSIVPLLPVLSALFVSMIGAAIVWKALEEMRIM